MASPCTARAAGREPRSESRATSPNDGLDATREACRTGWAAVVYGAFGLFLTCFVVVLVVRPDGWFWTFFVNWVIEGFEVLVAVMCLVRAVVGGTVRPVALTLGLGLLAWSFGDVVFSVLTLGGGIPPTPSWDDALYLAFYPLTYVGVILLLRMEVREVPLTTWLDGVVAGPIRSAISCSVAAASFGCDLVQGYFLGRPQPAGELVFPSTQPRPLNVRELSGGRAHRLEGR